jgi:hypothetical protein
LRPGGSGVDEATAVRDGVYVVASGNQDVQLGLDQPVLGNLRSWRRDARNRRSRLWSTAAGLRRRGGGELQLGTGAGGDVGDVDALVAISEERTAPLRISGERTASLAISGDRTASVRICGAPTLSRSSVTAATPVPPRATNSARLAVTLA